MFSRLLCALLLPACPLFALQAADPQAVLKRAMEVTGFSKFSDKILHTHDTQGVEQDYQSPAPFITMFNQREAWIDPKTGVERVSSQTVFPGSQSPAPSVSMVSQRGVYAITPKGAIAMPGSPNQQRNLDLWAVLADWRDAADVHPLSSQVFMDYPRTVLARKGEFGEERLFVDTKTGFPVKLDREEPHYLWGQVHVEFVYTIYQEKAGVTLPECTARMVDGFKEITRTTPEFELLDRDKAPDVTLPSVAPASDTTPVFLQATPPKKIEIDSRTFLTQNRGYTEGFVLLGDTVYILDATQSEKRARQDLELIQATFPGDHKYVLVVTDLAWPHIAGIRFWVASGATVISHRASQEFLTKVVERRWTREPDLLEQNRKTAKLHFVAVDKMRSEADGRLRLFAIDGIGSEGALMAYVPDNSWLWASDYVQNVSSPSAYATEVWQAVERAGLKPRQVAAMHIPLTPWTTIEALAKPKP